MSLIRSCTASSSRNFLRKAHPKQRNYAIYRRAMYPMPTRLPISQPHHALYKPFSTSKAVSHRLSRVFSNVAGASSSQELMKTVLMFSGLVHLEETLRAAGIDGIETLETAAADEESWSKLTKSAGLKEKEADYLLQSLALVANQGVRVRSDDGSPLSSKDAIFGDSKFMAGDFDE
eukprot:810206-Amorphochlora_amoeboformis.AAC.1